MQNYPSGYPQQPVYPPPPGQGSYPQGPGYPPSPGYPTAPPQQPYPAASGGLRYGGFWIRVAAYLVDTVILYVGNFLLQLIVGSIVIDIQIQNGGLSSSPPTSLRVILFVIGFIGVVLYFVLLWASGATLGQRLFKLRVVDAQTGQRIGYGRAIVRYIGLLLSSAPFDLGLMWVGWDSRKQGWHDKMAGTVVVRRTQAI